MPGSKTLLRSFIGGVLLAIAVGGAAAGLAKAWTPSAIVAALGGSLLPVHLLATLLAGLVLIRRTGAISAVVSTRTAWMIAGLAVCLLPARLGAQGAPAPAIDSTKVALDTMWVLQEHEGLDMGEHGNLTSPDFQMAEGMEA